MALRPRPALWFGSWDCGTSSWLSGRGESRFRVYAGGISSTVAGLYCPLRGRTPPRETFPVVAIVPSVCPEWFRNGTSVQTNLERKSSAFNAKSARHSRDANDNRRLSLPRFFILFFVILGSLGKPVYRQYATYCGTRAWDSSTLLNTDMSLMRLGILMYLYEI